MINLHDVRLELKIQLMPTAILLIGDKQGVSLGFRNESVYLDLFFRGIHKQRS